MKVTTKNQSKKQIDFSKKIHINKFKLILPNSIHKPKSFNATFMSMLC